MKTLNEIIEIIKAENPDGIRIGDDEQGYTELTEAEYEIQIQEWAKARMDKLAKLAEAEAVIEAKKEAIVKLAELGLDPKAFGIELPQPKEIDNP